MTLDADPDVADTVELYQAHLATLKRVESGSLDTRDWAKWHAEHPYVKHPRSKHGVEESPHRPEGIEGGMGTEKDPYRTNDVAKAAALLVEGHHVQLSQPRQVSTLMDKLHELVTEAAAKGEKAPNIDLCRVSVPGTNLFCAHNKGIPRLQMPQLSGKPTPGSPADAMPKDAHGEVDLSAAFIEHLRHMGVNVHDDHVTPSHLRASQSELVGKKVAQMYKAVQSGKLTKAPIFVSKDDYVVDGHHRWAAEAAADFDDGIENTQMPVHVVDLPISEILLRARQFQEDMGIAPKGARVAAGVLDTRSWAVFDALRPHHPRVKHGEEEIPESPHTPFEHGWKPVMTEEEAQRWMEEGGSKVRSPLYHGTFIANVPGIVRQGFDTRPVALPSTDKAGKDVALPHTSEKASRVNAQWYGQGTYLSTSQRYSYIFAGNNPRGVLVTHIAAANPASPRQTKAIIDKVKAQKPPLAQLPTLIREEAERQGYDALQTLYYDPKNGQATNWVVFDPHKIVIVQ